MCKGDYSKTSFWASGQPHCSLRAFMQHKRIALEWCAVTAEYLVVSLVCNVISCGPAQSRAIPKARLPNKTAARERGTTAEVQKANETVSAVIAHKAGQEAKEVG